jgi:cellulose synthase/poly-beta-1,6-N-acetylglucosamine synthase-like glycosyltransferase
MISIIITSWKESKTIGKAIECIAKSTYSGIPKDFQIIQVSPDKETLDAGNLKAKELGIEKNYLQLKDPQKGKPIALNMALKMTKGEIILLTDGDVYWGENAVKEMIDAFQNKSIGGVTGRPVAVNNRNTQFG